MPLGIQRWLVGIGRQLGHVAQSDRVNGTDVIEHRAALFEVHFAITGPQLREARSDAGELRRFPTYEPGEGPLPSGKWSHSSPSG